MAIHVKVIKNEKQDNEYVFYIYKFSYAGETYINAKGKTRCRRIESEGLIKINKASGDVVIVHEANGDKGFYAKRAAWALMKSWTNEEFPEQTSWSA